METIKFGRLPIEQEDGTIKTVDLEWLVIKEFTTYRKGIKGVARTLLCKSFPFTVSHTEMMDIAMGGTDIQNFEQLLRNKYTVEMFNLHEQELISNYAYWKSKRFWETYSPFLWGSEREVKGLSDQLDYHVLTTDDMTIQISYLNFSTIKFSDALDTHCRYIYNFFENVWKNETTSDNDFPVREEYGIRPVVYTFEPTDEAQD